MVKTTGAKPTKAETKANNKKKGAANLPSNHDKAAARQFENDQAKLKKERAEKKETQLAQAKEKDAMEAKKKDGRIGALMNIRSGLSFSAAYFDTMFDGCLHFMLVNPSKVYYGHFDERDDTDAESDSDDDELPDLDPIL
jgi:hypothetical protein